MPRILSVEDDPDLQELILSALSAAGFEVHQAFTGPEGHEKASSLKPDLILLDIMLPGFNGLQVLKLLKLQEKTRDIPVVIMTACSGDANVFEAEVMALGPREYLRKPLQFGALAQLVKRILHERAPGVNANNAH